MHAPHAVVIAKELNLPQASVAAVARLLEEGGTVPFIARYRKEATGSLDEVAVASVRDRLEQLAELEKRRAAILASLEERELLTEELRRAVEAAPDMARLEDVYLPYRPKRRTRAAMARERGLAPLAEALMAQKGGDPLALARPHVDPELGVADVEAALAGARDIIAETMSENAEARDVLRGLFRRKGRLASREVKGKGQEGAVYRDWFAWDEPLMAAPSHRVLALFRGEREGFLSLSLAPDDEEALQMLARRFVRGRGADSRQVEEAVRDGWKRLLRPSLENEFRALVKERADAEAIGVFAGNARQVLLAAPLGGKPVLALDPGYRTGAKTVALDAQGGLLEYVTLFPLGSDKQRREAEAALRGLCDRHKPAAVAVGNGTGGRETEAFVRGLDLGVPVTLVNESGASIYSASEVARREFPNLDLTVRGAVSIGRRLMDPLAELVKIDPKSLGVGQYQHDVDQGALKRALDEVVASCVNAVGVDLNTAGPEILAYVSGLGPALARNVVAHREEHGPFASRDELRRVKRLGPKAFEQAAGFLRVRGENVLDRSAVHPERYGLVKRMAKDLGCDVPRLMAEDALRERLDLDAYVSEDVGLPTLRDILEELARPGRDPRAAFSAFSFAQGVNAIADLVPGMVLPGVVTNVTKFGAFVDVGVHRDGLVHVSQLADRYVSDPAQVASVGQEVRVRVVEVDRERGRISLSMKTREQDREGRGN